MEIFTFLSWLFGYVEERLDKKVNPKAAWVFFTFFKLYKWYQIAQRTTYCPISQEVKEIRKWNLVSWQNITWEIFFFKNFTENGARGLVPDPFLFFKKALHKVKQVVSTLNLMYFGRPQIEHTIKARFITFQTVDLEIWSILIFYKKVWH